MKKEHIVLQEREAGPGVPPIPAPPPSVHMLTPGAEVRVWDRDTPMKTHTSACPWTDIAVGEGTMQRVKRGVCLQSEKSEELEQTIEVLGGLAGKVSYFSGLQNKEIWEDNPRSSS